MCFQFSGKKSRVDIVVTKYPLPHLQYCPLLKRIWFICTTWIKSFSLATTVEGKQKSSQKRESLSLYDLLTTGRHLSDVSFITSWKSNLPIAVTTQNTTEHNRITSNAQHTTYNSRQWIESGTYRLLVISGGRFSPTPPPKRTKVGWKLLSHHQYKLTPKTVLLRGNYRRSLRCVIEQTDRAAVTNACVRKAVCSYLDWNTNCPGSIFAGFLSPSRQILRRYLKFG
jgi:hypothetical protein